jgi:hypothetical protein
MKEEREREREVIVVVVKSGVELKYKNSSSSGGDTAGLGRTRKLCKYLPKFHAGTQRELEHGFCRFSSPSNEENKNRRNRFGHSTGQQTSGADKKRLQEKRCGTSNSDVTSRLLLVLGQMSNNASNPVRSLWITCPA